MEIIPGEGLPVARVGQTIAEIEAAAGPPTSSEPGGLLWRRHSPPFAVYFDHRGVAELVEVYHGENGHDQATLDGVQLTSRLMEDVLSDLAGAGWGGRRTDIVAEFDEGFTLWSLLSLSASDVGQGPAGAVDGEELVIEGVGIAPPHYWARC